MSGYYFFNEVVRLRRRRAESDCVATQSRMNLIIRTAITMDDTWREKAVDAVARRWAEMDGHDWDSLTVLIQMAYEAEADELIESLYESGLAPTGKVVA